jgi:hypothetical protein
MMTQPYNDYTTPEVDVSKPSPAKAHITDADILKLEAYCKRTYNVFDVHGNIDFEKAKNMIAYNAGDVYVEFNSLLLQERHVMADISADVNTSKANAFDSIKRDRSRGYDLTATDMKLFIEGHPLVVEQCKRLNKQKAFVNFLQNMLDQLGYYTNTVKTLIEAEKVKRMYNQ